MKVTINTEREDGEKTTIIFDDEHLDNDNFIQMVIDQGVYDVLLSEIMPALIAFDAKRSRRLSDEEHMS